MSSKTKIVVLRMKEIIYTVIFLVLAVLMIILLVSMFNKKDNAAPTSSNVQNASYKAGIYSASMTLNGQNIDLIVTVDSDYIKDISFVNLDESITTMYPLMQSSLDALTSQIIETQSIENLEIPAESQYTSKALLDIIDTALSKAK